MMKKVACVGILVADVIVEPALRYPGKGMLEQVNSITVHNGGNAMTASLNLRKLGVETAILGMIGKDMFGDLLMDRLTKANVDTSGLTVSGETQTSASVLLIDGDGERSFFHCTGANARFSYSDINFAAIEDCDMVFVTGSFLLDSFDGEGTRDFLKKCKDAGKTTFLDVCWDAKGQWGKLLDMSMPYIDYFMPSIDEAKMIAAKNDLEEIAEVFIAKGVKNVVIKLGPKGSYLRKKGEDRGKVFGAFSIDRPVDTTGAGDSFCSGFLAAWARGETESVCMEIANATGACSVTQKGATAGVKTYEETLSFIAARKQNIGK